MLKKFAVLGLALMMGVTSLTIDSQPAEARRGGAIIAGLIAGAVIGAAVYSHRRHRHRHYDDYGYSYAPAYAYSYGPVYRWGGHRHHRHHRHW